jgi:hypothetical protein
MRGSGLVRTMRSASQHAGRLTPTGGHDSENDGEDDGAAAANAHR